MNQLPKRWSKYIDTAPHLLCLRYDDDVTVDCATYHGHVKNIYMSSDIIFMLDVIHDQSCKKRWFGWQATCTCWLDGEAKFTTVLINSAMTMQMAAHTRYSAQLKSIRDTILIYSKLKKSHIWKYIPVGINPVYFTKMMSKNTDRDFIVTLPSWHFKWLVTRM